MPALVDLRRRIRSVKSTQQITKAMKMISAAKLRRAQDSIFAARPYARKMMEVLNGLATRAEHESHPLLQPREGRRTLLVVVTADRGLCGAFNANVIRAAAGFLAKRDEAGLSLGLVGRRGRDYFKRRRFAVRSERVGVFQPLEFYTARELSAELMAYYQAE
jgi:F-type H+-transporting ATPase subunit gamma